jgi:hypothetical protein
METLIYRRIKGFELKQAHKTLKNIRGYKFIGKKGKFNPDEYYNVDIRISHAKNENPSEIFDNHLKLN